ncbi:MAG: hypothetical protein UU47_C0012G0001 [candidate division TM6 bacterium GW2011_GWE2_41_16]|nr:MAG: hypothetical protein UU47_C0012G0001 [candidate division TM6 bacterium GW2011_GWE2_41_16]
MNIKNFLPLILLVASMHVMGMEWTAMPPAITATTPPAASASAPISSKNENLESINDPQYVRECINRLIGQIQENQQKNKSLSLEHLIRIQSWHATVLSNAATSDRQETKEWIILAKKLMEALYQSLVPLYK